MDSAGKRFRIAVQQHHPLPVIGTINAMTALLAKQQHVPAIYLSGAGVANASYGMPDLGVTNLNDVLIDARRITDVCDVPLLVDIDTGWGTNLTIARAIKSLEDCGVAAIHIEDQEVAKRCGHRPDKRIVATCDMVDRIKAAVDARRNSDFVIMARSDALASEGLSGLIERAQAYVAAGADMIFAEAVTELADYRKLSQAISQPILANITEFGKTPLFTQAELHDAGVALVLYPLSAFRAMNYAATQVYHTIIRNGTQRSVLDIMQTREQLYETLDYYRYEQQQ